MFSGMGRGSAWHARGWEEAAARTARARLRNPRLATGHSTKFHPSLRDTAADMLMGGGWWPV